ncbi:protein MpPPR_9 [Marchantia polymorpha subsp. ruderalis]|nr:hypothetical protein MARPO_0009s0070 [Marchantia polymorpha]BBN17350.1 hypothetical protein Mp_7g13850 [Marchantia polymorpha subsp. ruderalis]|eukprot:PTQ46954.1 hypothetical protein MARPO_0009s0070 [Marchantia polymorpha]
MMSRWYIVLERFGKRQALVNSHINLDTSQLSTRAFSSDIVFPTITSRNPKSSTAVTQDRDPGVFYLTQLFAKLLKLGEDNNASKLIKDMKTLDSPVTVVVCNYLLNSCSKSRNPKMAKEVWNFMQSNKIQINKVSYGCLIGALSRGGCIGEATELLTLLANKNEANLVMYNTVLNGCVHTKSKAQAERCIQLMEKQGVPKDERTYMELIKLSGMLGDLSATRRWWTQLVGKFTPTSTVRSSYIIALCRMNDLNEARQALQDLVSVYGHGKATHLTPLDEGATQQSRFVSGEKSEEYMESSVSGENEEAEHLSEQYGSKQLAIDELDKDSDDSNHLNELDSESDDPELNESQRTSSSNGKEDEMSLFTEGDVEVPGFPAELALRGMKISDITSTGLKDLQNSYNAMINAAGKAKNHILAECLFSEMRQLGLKMDIYTYNALLRAVLEGRGVKHGLRILKRMDTIGIKPNVHSLTALLEAYCRDRKFSKVDNVLDYMESGSRSQHPSCHTYNIVLNACISAEDPERALQAFGRMKAFGAEPDICTYIALFTVLGNTRSEPEGSSPWSQRQVAKRITAIELDMDQSGIQHTRESFTSLMHVLGAQGLTELMLQRLKDAIKVGKDILDVTSFNTVILSCVNVNQVETAWEVYQQMKSAGFKPDEYTYNILINGCTHEKKLSTAFELVDTMRQDGLSPNVVTFNTLLKVICHSGEMDIVLDLLKEMTASGVQPDTATFNTILTSASYQKRVDVMEHMLEEMRRSNISPDDQTFLPVVSTYMQAGQTEDAAEALRVLSFRMLDNCKPKDEAGNLQRNLVQGVIGDLARKNLNLGMNTRELLKDAVLHTSPEALAIYTASLAGLVQGDSENSDTEQSLWAARLSAQYDHNRTSRFTNLR